MNRVILMGRLTKDPDVRVSGNVNTNGEQNKVARYSLAVDRRYAKKGDDNATDFINCVAFGRQAEFAEKYLTKGMRILIEGRIQTGSYTNKDGQRVYTTDVVVEQQEFADSKGAAGTAPANNSPASMDDFMSIPDDDDGEGLPFC